MSILRKEEIQIFFNKLSVKPTRDEKSNFKIPVKVPELCSSWNEHF